jgi:hypothetical protein
MKKIFTLIYMCVAVFGYAQEVKKDVPKTSFLKENYVNFTDFGGLFGKSYTLFYQNSTNGYSVNPNTHFTFQTYNGVKVYKNLSVGATVGVDWFSNFQVLPVSVGIRNVFGDTKTKKVKIFSGLDAGYGLMILNEKTADNQTIRGGLALSPTVGLMIPTGGNAHFTLSLGYKHNAFNSKIENTSRDNFYLNETDYKFNRMAVKLGFAF